MAGGIILYLMLKSMFHTNQLYLARVFRKSKLLFIAIVLFIIFQSYFFLKREYSFPFYVWDMYSRVEGVSDTLVRNELLVDHQLLNTTQLTIWQDALLANSFKEYLVLKRNKNQDPVNGLILQRTDKLPKNIRTRICKNIENDAVAVFQFPGWIFGYIQEITHNHIQEISFEESTYLYNRETTAYTKTGSKLLFEIHKKDK